MSSDQSVTRSHQELLQLVDDMRDSLACLSAEILTSQQPALHVAELRMRKASMQLHAAVGELAQRLPYPRTLPVSLPEMEA